MKKIEDEASKMIKIKVNKSNISKSTCNCKTFFKNFKCKHILEIAIKLKKTEKPVQYKLVKV